MKYLVILLGASIGMLFTVLVKSAMVHRSQKYQINFAQAVRFYLTKNVGNVLVGAIVVLIFLYLFPGVLAAYNNLDEDNPGKYDSYYRAVITHLREFSLGIGAFGQVLGFVFYRAGEKALRKYDAELSEDKNVG